MSEIKFKATRRKHSSGWREIEKSGDLQFDGDRNSRDGIWLYPKNGKRIFIDCDNATGVFRIVFDDKEFEVQR